MQTKRIAPETVAWVHWLWELKYPAVVIADVCEISVSSVYRIVRAGETQD